MADIFISYSKADRPLALKLSAFLESEGWTVWWDKSLGAANLYRPTLESRAAMQQEAWSCMYIYQEIASNIKHL
jgi:hypothetical protein